MYLLGPWIGWSVNMNAGGELSSPESDRARMTLRIVSYPLLRYVIVPTPLVRESNRPLFVSRVV